MVLHICFPCNDSLPKLSAGNDAPVCFSGFILFYCSSYDSGDLQRLIESLRLFHTKLLP